MDAKEIALKCNVSLSTVSRVLNNKPGVNSKVRKQIIELIKAENKSENFKFLKKIKNSYHIKNILLLIPRVNNSNYFNTLTEKILTLGAKRNMNIYVKYSNSSEKKEYEILDEMAGTDFYEGVIFLNSTHFDEYVPLKKSLNSLKKPLVLLHNYIVGTNVSGVFIDNINLCYKITNYFLDLNKINIALIVGEKESEASQKRVEGFKVAFKEHNIPLENSKIIYTDWSDSNIANDKILEFLSSNPKVDAFICGDENIAFELIACYKKLNLKPLDDNFIFSWHKNDFLIKLGHNFLHFKDDLETLANYSLDLLLEQSENKTFVPKKISLSSDIELD